MKFIVFCIALIAIANKSLVASQMMVPEDSEIGKLLKESVTNGLTQMYQTPYKLKKVREMKSEQTVSGLKFKLLMDYDIGNPEIKITVSFYHGGN